MHSSEVPVLRKHSCVERIIWYDLKVEIAPTVSVLYAQVSCIQVTLMY